MDFSTLGVTGAGELLRLRLLRHCAPRNDMRAKGTCDWGPSGGARVRQLCKTRRPRQKSPKRVSTRVSGPISQVGSVELDFCRTHQTKPICQRRRRWKVLYWNRVTRIGAGLPARENKANLPGQANGGHSPTLRIWRCAGAVHQVPILPHYSSIPPFHRSHPRRGRAGPGVQNKPNSASRACRRGRGRLS
jgi:hypothetical protein